MVAQYLKFIKLGTFRYLHQKFGSFNSKCSILLDVNYRTVLQVGMYFLYNQVHLPT